ncbi:acyl-CoA dehydrogenase family protein [Streptomyces boncukensis]|uniref:Acyl-CoA/acyl-ACP dehydrogenase n=1 Tax=Streptomyces boncukensis TaxID=2711219 RepID=A0A6G4WNS2_9ACTN|nr:acyl-CoA/acyl-ACP dehydrogenase [Streptomyces boncukensis]
MRTLDSARATCEHYHPGLGKALEEIEFEEREYPGSPVIALFREHDGVGLLVPEAFGGKGADPVDAVRVMRAVGSYSPSLAAAATMHHFTAATLYSLTGRDDGLTAAQRALLRGVVPSRKLMASGWAEGRTRQNVLTPSVAARPVAGGYLLSGAKKPCSLSRSMDLLTASVSVPDARGRPEPALALIAGDAPGITVHPFWGNGALAAAESDEVRLADVFVPEELVLRTGSDDPERLSRMQSAGFIWFELLISAGYAGAAAALVRRVLEHERGSVTDRAALAVRAESAHLLLEGTARAVRDGDLDGEAAVASVLIARYAAQEALSGAADLALELLGGMDFIRSREGSLLASAVRPLAFHPPSRTSTAEPLVAYLAGAPLALS